MTDTTANDDRPGDEPVVAARRSPLRNPVVRLGLVAAGVVLLVAGGFWLVHHLTYGRYQQSTDDAYVAADFVAIAPRIAGTVEAVLVRENQWVEAGQPLARISGQDYRAQRDQAQAQIDIARASARAATANIAQQRAGLAQARAQLEAAQADLRFLEGEVARYAPLAATGAEADVQFAQLRSNRDKAAAQVRAAQAAVLTQQRQIPAIEAQRDQALAQARAAEAQVSGAEVSVDATILRASVSGRVGNLTVRVGQTVQPGTRLMSIVPTDSFYIDARFKETQMARVRPGQAVRLEIDAFSDAELRGVVDSVAPATTAQFALIPPQNATGNFTKIVQRVPVRIRLEGDPNALARLVSGLSVTATIDTRGQASGTGDDRR